MFFDQYASCSSEARCGPGVAEDDRQCQRTLEETPMPTRYGRQCIIALSAATLLVACKPKENATTDTTTAAGAAKDRGVGPAPGTIVTADVVSAVGPDLVVVAA
jgi:hypothetical protein